MDKLKKEQGFTLLEIIIAVSILTVGILAAASLQLSSIRGNHFAGETSEASAWAVTCIESLMGKSYNDADLTAGSHGPVIKGKYNISWTVLVNDLTPGTKTVIIAVTWAEYGSPRNITMNFTLGEIV